MPLDAGSGILDLLVTIIACLCQLCQSQLCQSHEMAKQVDDEVGNGCIEAPAVRSFVSKDAPDLFIWAKQ